MPVNKSVMAKFVEQYGKKKGKKVYYATAASHPKVAKAVGEKK